MIELEQSLQIEETQKSKSAVCDLARYRELHFVGAGEPVTELNPEDKQEFYVLLRRSGVPKRDVEKTIARVERMERLEPEEDGAEKPTPKIRAIGLGTVRTAVESLRDLVRIDNSPRLERIPVRQEVALFERKRS